MNAFSAPIQHRAKRQNLFEEEKPRFVYYLSLCVSTRTKLPEKHYFRDVFHNIYFITCAQYCQSSFILHRK